MTSWPFSNSPRSETGQKKPFRSVQRVSPNEQTAPRYDCPSTPGDDLHKTPRLKWSVFLEEGRIFLTRIHKKTPFFFASAFFGGENCCYNLIWCFFICFFWWLLVQHVHSQRNFERYGPVLQFTMLCAEATKAFSKSLQNSHWDSSLKETYRFKTQRQNVRQETGGHYITTPNCFMHDFCREIR